MIYFLTAIGLTSGGVHIYTQTIHRTKKSNNRTTQITNNVEECGPRPVFANLTLALFLTT